MAGAGLVELPCVPGTRRGFRRHSVGRVQAAARLPVAGSGGLPEALAVPHRHQVGDTTTDDDEDQGVLAYLLLAFGLAWSTIFVARLLLGLSLENSLVQIPIAFSPPSRR